MMSVSFKIPVFVYCAFILLNITQASLVSKDKRWVVKGDKFPVVSSEKFHARSRVDCARLCQVASSCHSFAWEKSSATCYVNPEVTTPANVTGTTSTTALLINYDLYPDNLCPTNLCPNFTGPHVRTVAWEPCGTRGRISSCDDNYMTSVDPATIQCINNSWSGATCNQRIWTNPSMGVTYNAPRPKLQVGWKCRVQGVMNNNNGDANQQRIQLYLMETPSDQWLGAFIIKIASPDVINTTWFETRIKGQSSVWLTTQNINPFPLAGGKNFTVVFEFLTNKMLQMTVDGVAHVVWTYEYLSNLTQVTGIYLGPTSSNNVYTYIDLWYP